MILNFPTRDGAKRRGMAAAVLIYALALVLVPAHGHDLGLLGQPYDGAPEQPAQDHHVDCFLCQVLATAALPGSAPALDDAAPLVTADLREVDFGAAASPTLRTNARAPPAR